MRKTARAIIVKDNCLLVMKRNKFGQSYYALVGGGVDIGETAEQTLTREVQEETGLTFTNPRLVIIEDAGEMFGTQYIFHCDYASGQPALSPNSEEAKITALGKNTYQPVWLPLDQLTEARLLPIELRDLLIEKLANGFPTEPIELKIPG